MDEHGDGVEGGKLWSLLFCYESTQLPKALTFLHLLMGNQYDLVSNP